MIIRAKELSYANSQNEVKEREMQKSAIDFQKFMAVSKKKVNNG